jgi:hypothetical protein
MVSKAVGGSVNHCGGEQRKYDGVDFTILYKQKEEVAYIHNQKQKHWKVARRILIYSTNAET